MEQVKKAMMGGAGGTKALSIWRIGIVLGSFLFLMKEVLFSKEFYPSTKSILGHMKQMLFE